jgi:hypothetical protein
MYAASVMGACRPARRKASPVATDTRVMRRSRKGETVRYDSSRQVSRVDCDERKRR